MSAGFFGLLDDVAAIAKLAAASVDDLGAATGRATAKAVGVVVDDTAVTPQYVHGIAAERELPIIWRIAKGSLRNKLVIILPVALVLSQWLPWLLTPILMVGGCYLSYEGAEKVWERLGSPGGRAGGGHGELAVEPDEKALVAGAVRTDLILSAEIMVIALDEIADSSFWQRLVVLAVVGVALTAVVYGVVGLIVKMDDAGLILAQRRSAAAQRAGRALVRGMPGLLQVISVVGVAAMIWVGGHILLSGTHELHWHWPYDRVHRLEHAVHGGVQGWLVTTAISALVGLVVGALLVGVLHLVPRRH